MAEDNDLGFSSPSTPFSRAEERPETPVSQMTRRFVALCPRSPVIPRLNTRIADQVFRDVASPKRLKGDSCSPQRDNVLCRLSPVFNENSLPDCEVAAITHCASAPLTCRSNVDSALESPFPVLAVRAFTSPVPLPPVSMDDEQLPLPLVADGSARDLQCISASTLVSLLGGSFSQFYDRVIIVDCRFPEEYDGGHIEGALNLHTPQLVEEHFFGDMGMPSDRTAIVFHCEFSQQRGPAMYVVCRSLARFLRRTDRSLHMEVYPALSYRHLYLLDKGYKEFYTHYQGMCNPQAYIPMKESAQSDLACLKARRRVLRDARQSLRSSSVPNLLLSPWN